MTDETERSIHTASLLRLQVAHNALEAAATVLRDTVLDLPAIAKRLTAFGETAMAEDVTEMRAKLDTILPLIRAALDIARGARTDVPPALRGSLAPDTAMITRFLEIPAGR
jgi:hypothetical protein